MTSWLDVEIVFKHRPSQKHRVEDPGNVSITADEIVVNGLSYQTSEVERLDCVQLKRTGLGPLGKVERTEEFVLHPPGL